MTYIERTVFDYEAIPTYQRDKMDSAWLCTVCSGPVEKLVALEELDAGFLTSTKVIQQRIKGYRVRPCGHNGDNNRMVVWRFRNLIFWP